MAKVWQKSINGSGFINNKATIYWSFELYTNGEIVDILNIKMKYGSMLIKYPEGKCCT
jgi:hypothetical protein